MTTPEQLAETVRWHEPRTPREIVQQVKMLLDHYPGAPCSCPRHIHLLDAKAALDSLLAAHEEMRQRMTFWKHEARRRSFIDVDRVEMCAVTVSSSWHDPVKCALPADHLESGIPHSWASLPQFDPIARAEAALEEMRQERLADVAAIHREQEARRAAERENATLRENVRVREEAQIPMIPRAAGERLRAAEREVERLREALKRISRAHADVGHIQGIARAALASEQDGE